MESHSCSLESQSEQTLITPRWPNKRGSREKVTFQAEGPAPRLRSLCTPWDLTSQHPPGLDIMTAYTWYDSLRPCLAGLFWIPAQEGRLLSVYECHQSGIWVGVVKSSVRNTGGPWHPNHLGRIMMWKSYQQRGREGPTLPQAHMSPITWGDLIWWFTPTQGREGCVCVCVYLCIWARLNKICKPDKGVPSPPIKTSQNPVLFLHLVRAKAEERLDYPGMDRNLKAASPVMMPCRWVRARCSSEVCVRESERESERHSSPSLCS